MSKEIDEFYLQHEKKMNAIILKNFYIIGLVPFAVLLCNYLGIFHYPVIYVIMASIVSFLGMIFLNIINKSKLPTKYFKFIVCTFIQVLCSLFFLDYNLQITVTFILVPIFSIFYFDPKFSLYSCILAFLASEASILIVAEETTAHFWPNDTVQDFILATSIGRTMEIGMASILICSSTVVAKNLLESLKKRNDEIEVLQREVIFSFADMIESRDGTTGDHVKRTSQVVSLISDYILTHPEENVWTLSKADLLAIIQAAPLHDIGKLRTPDSILSKNASLTDDEFVVIKKHPNDGEQIIKKTLSKVENNLFLNTACDMAKYHHEKWDGSGYPTKLEGEQIPISARIMAVADVLDALCSVRSYKVAFTLEEAFTIMKKSSGSQFEPKLIEILESIKPQLKQIYEQKIA